MKRQEKEKRKDKKYREERRKCRKILIKRIKEINFS
jgi:hypothetical protein